MSDSNPRSQSWTTMALCAAVVLLVSGLYCLGYFYLGDEWRPGPLPGPHPIRMRVFPLTWLAVVYRPAAWVESHVRGYPVTAGDREMLMLSSP